MNIKKFCKRSFILFIITLFSLYFIFSITIVIDADIMLSESTFLKESYNFLISGIPLESLKIGFAVSFLFELIPYIKTIIKV